MLQLESEPVKFRGQVMSRCGVACRSGPGVKLPRLPRFAGSARCVGSDVLAGAHRNVRVDVLMGVVRSAGIADGLS